MVHRKIVDFATEHRHALIFAAGIATAVVGKKILESDAVKEATTNAVAGVISVKKDAEEKVDEIKKDAEAIACAEECEEEKVEIEVEEVEEKTSKKSKKSKK
ncbi:hypothetical protein [Methanobrevibacter sp.]|uniref:hypothetical protein n=1 Tax=Methanobrevibacter sp. TaxID=66852 RepID=UPI00388FB8F5